MSLTTRRGRGQAEQLTGYRTGALFTLKKYRSSTTADQVEKRTLVSGNSIVTLFHAEEQGFLSCDEEGRLFFLKSRSAQGTENKFHPRSLWTFERQTQDRAGLGEPLRTSLDPTRWDKEGMLNRLVHVMTGRFLLLPPEDGTEARAELTWKGDIPSI